ncbi:MAG: hypothetical protein HY962_04985 [Ignavibacteriae bacterium]|nr:hypothetical protein [Ignavibacteriota bacterium]
MAKSLAPVVSQFSFDTMVSEVNAIVEDLRWLHLELSLRNRCNEVLFHDVPTVEELLRYAFEDLRLKIGALELSVYVKDGSSHRIGFRDIEPSIPWSQDAVPWQAPIARWLTQHGRDAAAPQPDVSHYTVNDAHVSAAAVPVSIGRETIAAVLIVTLSSTTVPRLRKFLAGLSGSLGLSIDFIRKSGKSHEPSGDAAATVPADPQLPLPFGAGPGVRQMLDALRFPALLLTRGLAIAHANAAATELLMYVEPREGPPHFEDLIARQSRDAARTRCADILRGISHGASPARLAMRGPDGTILEMEWSIELLPDADGEPSLLAVGAGASLPGAAMRPAQNDGGAGRFRLSKQYRFMMKYVPFPVAHLDESLTVILNANPAFAEVIGSDAWEGVPLGDFGTLDVHSRPGDAKPCALSVVSPNGITLVHRGIVTPVEIFGRMMQEITLEPLDTTRER